MAALFATGRIVDLILLVVVLEAAATLIWHRRTGRGLTGAEKLSGFSCRACAFWQPCVRRWSGLGSVGSPPGCWRHSQPICTIWPAAGDTDIYRVIGDRDWAGRYWAGVKCQSRFTLIAMDQVTLDRPAPPVSRTDPRPHAVVIGSGFGGLAAAIRLGARGYRVTVLERLAAPGGRAEVFRRDGFTFDLGPTIMTAPFLFEELWHLCGRRMADDVTCDRLDPFYRIRFDDGTIFHYSGDPAAMRAEVARFCPADVAGYERFMRAERSDLPNRLRAARRTCRSDRGPTWPASCRTCCACAAIAACTRMVSRYISDPRLRMVFSFHPLLIGGNPFTTTAIYSLIPLPGAAVGRALRDGRHRARWCAAGRPHRGAGRRACAATPRCAEITVADGARHRRAPGVRRADRRRHRRLECRFGLDLSASAAGACAPALDRPAHRARALLDEPVRLVFRHRRQYRRCRAPHDSAGAALPRAARRHLSAQGAGGRLQPVSASADRDRPIAAPPDGATPSMCSRRCRISPATPTGRHRPSPIGARSHSA